MIRKALKYLHFSEPHQTLVISLGGDVLRPWTYFRVMAVDVLIVMWHVCDPIWFEIFVLCTDVQKPPPPAVSFSNGLLQTSLWMMVNLAWSLCSEIVTSD